MIEMINYADAAKKFLDLLEERQEWRFRIFVTTFSIKSEPGVGKAFGQEGIKVVSKND
jgi:hypothetical protein